MDIFEAIRVFLTGFCANVSHVMFPFDGQRMHYEGVVPAITYEFTDLAGIATHSGGTAVRKVALEINLWGDLAEILPMKEGISERLNGETVKLSGFEFSLVEKLVRDIFEPNVTFRRILMRYEGVIVG